MSSNFKYESVLGPGDGIRLVEMHIERSDIVCTLQSTAIENAPPFEALSYCWGMQDKKMTILLNGQAFQVGENLHAALSMLKCVESMGEAGDEVEIRSTRRLWIDAICINQEDVIERSHQVKLMWKIYSRASRVLVWLGEEQDDSSAGMGMISLLSLSGMRSLRSMIETARRSQTRMPDQELKSFDSNPQPDLRNADDETDLTVSVDPAATVDVQSQSSHTTDEHSSGQISFFHMTGSYRFITEQSSDSTLRRSRSESNLSQEGSMRPVTDEDELSMVPFHLLFANHEISNAEDPPLWIAVAKLMQRPWWQRVWVIQEIAAAQGEALVGCGSCWIKWHRFVLAQHCVERYKDIPGLERLRRFSAGMARIADKFSLSRSADSRLDNWNGLLYLLYHSIEYHASEPRDRIYALLGFIPSLNLEVNYEIPVPQLYENIVRQSIRNTGNLHILGLSRKPKKLSLPSWVPDFSMSLALDAYNVQCPMGFFGADGNNWHNVGARSPGCIIKDTDRSGHLALSGFCYDTNLATGTVFRCERATQLSIVLEVINDYERLLHDIDRQHFPDRVCHHRQAEFWRTLIWNATEHDHYPADDNYGTYFSKMRTEKHFIFPLDDDKLAKTRIAPETHSSYRTLPRQSNAHHYYRAFIRNGLNRRFFITKRGHLGSGPVDLQKDDQICILLGMKSPAVLRQSINDTTKWQWVGQAYVHGIMHGEALGSLTSESNVEPSGMAPRNTLALSSICLV